MTGHCHNGFAPVHSPFGQVLRAGALVRVAPNVPADGAEGLWYVAWEGLDGDVILARTEHDALEGAGVASVDRARCTPACEVEATLEELEQLRWGPR